MINVLLWLEDLQNSCGRFYVEFFLSSFYFYTCFIVNFHFSSRVSSIEADSRYKHTWGIGGGDGEVDANGSKVVSKQPPGVRNGQAAQANAQAPSGPYVKR